jgi:hypothetical protein
MTDESTKRPSALDTPGDKIWRYVDLQKLVSMLSTRTLYFPRPSAFRDPYEGWMPRSHMDALAGINQNYIAQQHDLRRQFAAINPNADLTRFNEGIQKNIETYAEQAKRAPMEAVQKFGVTCWHKSEYESEAMWSAYPAESIAIESTVGQLHAAHRTEKNVFIDNVRYMDFDRDPIEKGYSQYLLFLKRKSFEHEREVRGTVLLGDGTEGAFLDYDLDVLVTQIHVSPRASAEFRHAVTDIVAGNVRPLDKPVLASTLYEKPGYGINLKLTED